MWPVHDGVVRLASWPVASKVVVVTPSVDCAVSWPSAVSITGEYSGTLHFMMPDGSNAAMTVWLGDVPNLAVP